MKLIIDGHEIEPRIGESLLDITKKLGFFNGSLANDPIAAKIAGEVFTLNYIPLRKQDVYYERASMRKAMAASDGIVKLLRYRDPLGRDVYTKTAQFIIFYAASKLYPNSKVKMSCSVSSALYFRVKNAEDFSAVSLKNKVREIIESDIPLLRKTVPTSEAIEMFRKKGQLDKTNLLSYRPLPTVDLYCHDEFFDYFYGEMAPTTAHLKSWDILDAPGGFVFLYPDRNDPDRVSKMPELPKLLSVYNDGKDWGSLMECENAADLNSLVDSGRIRELIRVNEALHEKRFSSVADQICEKGCRAVLISGPSSSGKTTSANRLATQLRVHGKKPILMSLDDYYIDRHLIPIGEDGKQDLEHIDTIDTALFKEHLKSILSGESVELPSFNFKSGLREWRGHRLTLEKNSVIIVEGLHALNPMLLPDGIDNNLIFKLYVSPLLPLNLDDHNRISASYLRLLRRTVRDFETRGASVQKTLSMWDSVRRGEEKWIFPYQENADVIFNTSTLYELAVLKKHIFPLLTAIEPSDECYEEVRAMVKILNFIHEADVDDEIPPTSIVREFIGGNSFYK